MTAAGSGGCRRSRLTLSIVLDGEASAGELAEAARHLPGCEDCARFAAVAAELKRRLDPNGVTNPMMPGAPPASNVG